MSDRMWLGEGRLPVAEVNLDDHGSVEAAIQAQEFDRPLKVFGPAQKLVECYAAWKRLHEEGTVRYGPDMATWVIKPSLTSPAGASRVWRPS